MVLKKHCQKAKIIKTLDKWTSLMYTVHMTSQKYYSKTDTRKALNFYPSDSTLSKIQKAKELHLHGLSYGKIAEALNISRTYAFQIVNFEIPQRKAVK